MTATPAELKACCASAYAGEAAHWLLGDRLHPGGAELTSRLAQALGVGPRAVVVDVASGPGTSTLQVARDTGCHVVGVDFAPASVRVARENAAAAGLSDRARFFEGDAEALPLDDAAVDGAICECALCIFPDKLTAVSEIARVLKPGGRLALSDMVADRDRLPDELRTLEAWVACFADARPLEEVEELLAAAGLEPELSERHDAALEALLDRVEGRLRAVRLIGRGVPAALAGNAERGLALVKAARDAVRDGALGYAVVIARRG